LITRVKNKEARRLLITSGVILWIAVVAYFVRWISGQFSKEFNDILFFISFVLLFISWELLRLVHNKLNELLPFEGNIVLRIVVQIFIGIVVAFLVRYATYKFGEPFLPFKLDSLFLASTWALYALAVTGVNGVFFIRYFLERWKDSLVRAERLEKEKSQVQFDNLKNQLNPHFLFNALTSLNSLITEDPALAQQFLQQMSKVYRYVLQNKDKNFVALSTELDFIRNFVFLIETRFADALKIQFNIPESAKEKAIVPVTLQVLIENALKHNVVDQQQALTIDIFTADDYLVVTNNLQLRNSVETSNKQGLENLKSLYSFFTNKSVIIEKSAQRFSVKVPLL
jgi:two-component system, LytTR family, sensor kinase